MTQGRAKTTNLRNIQNLIRAECCHEFFLNLIPYVLEHNCIYKKLFSQIVNDLRRTNDK